MKKIARFILLMNFLFCTFLLKAQLNSAKYDKESFILGTLDEYMGYQRTFTNRDSFSYQRVDILGEDELKHALFIDSLFSADYPDMTITNNGSSRGIKIYSPTLASVIDKYYDYKPGFMMSGKGDTIYSGSLKKEKIVTEKQMLSFILGAYLRFGENANRTDPIVEVLTSENIILNRKVFDKETYAISMHNASSKAELCAAILKELQCEYVEYFYRRSIPAGNYVLFIPSQKVKNLISEADSIKMYIEKISTNHVKFTADGTKFIWIEPFRPKFNQNQ